MDSNPLKRDGNIDDFYLIEENNVLGEGASAVVRKGIKKETGEVFAIKIIDKSHMSADELKDLYKELKIMSMVDHPNIVRVYEYYECYGVVFIVMEMMSGGELFDRIVEVEHYTEKQASEAFRPIVDAVRYCHSLGIVHRDLKPENLLYSSNDEDGVLKVSDFGLAIFLIPQSNEKLYTACGTPSYIAPEVINSLGYDGQVDSWSLGVILYVMLCGFPPFYADDNNELFNLIKSGDYEFHSPYWDSISEDAKDLIKKLLVVDPKQRLTPEQILNHKWLLKTDHNKANLDMKEQYINYKNKNKIKNVVMANFIIKLWQKITFKKNNS